MTQSHLIAVKLITSERGSEVNVGTRGVFSVFIVLLLMQNTISGQEHGAPHTLGEYRVFESKVLNEERQLLIYMPEDYHSSEESYLTLYVLDGDWNFLLATAYVDVLSSEKRIPKMIVVAVLNVDRLRDFLPTHVDQVPSSGGSDDFVQFINTELIPFVEREYRVKPSRILYGTSNSGLYAIYHLLRSPDSFDAYAVGSPTLRHDDFFVNDLADSVFANQRFSRKHLFVAYGRNEGDWLISPIEEFEDVLRDRSPEGLIWEVREFDGEGHVPPMSLFEGLKFIFDDQDALRNINQK